MSELSAWLIPLATGLAGIVFGTFLRPVVEDWYQHRKKTIHVLSEGDSRLSPVGTEMAIRIGDRNFVSVISKRFRLENRTRTTFRNIVITLRPSSSPRRTTSAVFAFDDPGDAIFEMQDRGSYSELHVKQFPPRSSVSGTMITETAADVFATVDGDLEVVRGVPQNAAVEHMIKSIAALLTALAAMALSAGIFS